MKGRVAHTASTCKNSAPTLLYSQTDIINTYNIHMVHRFTMLPSTGHHLNLSEALLRCMLFNSFRKMHFPTNYTCQLHKEKYIIEAGKGIHNLTMPLGQSMTGHALSSSIKNCAQTDTQTKGQNHRAMSSLALDLQHYCRLHTTQTLHAPQ